MTHTGFCSEGFVAARVVRVREGLVDVTAGFTGVSATTVCGSVCALAICCRVGGRGASWTVNKRMMVFGNLSS